MTDLHLALRYTTAKSRVIHYRGPVSNLRVQRQKPLGRIWVFLIRSSPSLLTLLISSTNIRNAVNPSN